MAFFCYQVRWASTKVWTRFLRCELKLLASFAICKCTSSCCFLQWRFLNPRPPHLICLFVLNFVWMGWVPHRADTQVELIGFHVSRLQFQVLHPGEWGGCQDWGERRSHFSQGAPCNPKWECKVASKFLQLAIIPFPTPHLEI